MFKSLRAWWRLLRLLRDHPRSWKCEEGRINRDYEGHKLAIEIVDGGIVFIRYSARLFVDGVEVPLGPWRRFRLRNFALRLLLVKIGQAL